tara:strand:- start:623 stop:1720 length:1098 start_codon:yes stop_codon:yes gene_type:complete
MKYDYLIVGSGLFGCVFANLAKQHNKRCLILEKREHAFGNCYTELKNDIHIHKYGPHIFHTNNNLIWDYVKQFSNFNNFIYKPKVSYQQKLFSFPINLMTLHQLWGVRTPNEAILKINQEKYNLRNPQNLEEWALSQVGEEIYYKFIYGYTKKQWNTDPKNLPASIIKRLPIRFYFDENYYFDKYQGIPIDGYSKLLARMIDGIEVVLGTDYFKKQDYWDKKCKYIVYTGSLDKFFNYEYGELDYRSLQFKSEEYNIKDYQGNAAINYTEERIPYTRIIEHKHFHFNDNDKTIITKEYPANFKDTQEPYYPINNKKNDFIYNNYKKLLNYENKSIFGGRLAEYRYYNMDQIIASAMSKFNKVSNM